MKQTQLRNIYLKLRTISSKLAYTKQRNYCVAIIRKSKKEYYGRLDVKDIADNKKFWKTVKPLFSDKSKSRRTKTLVEDVKIESNHKKIVDIFNIFFANVVTSFEVPEFDTIDQLSENISQPMLKVQPCKLYNNKYMIPSTQITNTEIFAFKTVLVFKLLSHKILFINRKDNRSC